MEQIDNRAIAFANRVAILLLAGGVVITLLPVALIGPAAFGNRLALYSLIALALAALPSAVAYLRLRLSIPVAVGFEKDSMRLEYRSPARTIQLRFEEIASIRVKDPVRRTVELPGMVWVRIVTRTGRRISFPSSDALGLRFRELERPLGSPP